MSQIQSTIIEELNNTASDMAQIIGRYKGSLKVYRSELKRILDSGSVGDREAATVEYIISSMGRLIAENDQLWKNRGKREVPTDIVQLERA